jgi:hypothetical protein
LGGVFSTWCRPDVHLSIPPPGQPYPARRLAHTEAGKSERSMFIEPIRPGPASVPKNRKEPVLSPNAVVTSYTQPAPRPFHSSPVAAERRTAADHSAQTNTLHPLSPHQNTKQPYFQHNFTSLQGGSAKHRASITGVPAYRIGCTLKLGEPQQHIDHLPPRTCLIANHAWPFARQSNWRICLTFGAQQFARLIFTGGGLLSHGLPGALGETVPTEPSQRTDDHRPGQ